MSDIKEEQKRLYKRAEENDIKLLQDRINKAYKVLDEITFYTTPIGQVVHLDMIISDIKKVKSILKGKE